MNDTSGFQKCDLLPPNHQRIASCTSNSPNSEQYSWHLHHTHDLIALLTGISTKREKVPDTFFMLNLSHCFRGGSRVRLKRVCRGLAGGGLRGWERKICGPDKEVKRDSL